MFKFKVGDRVRSLPFADAIYTITRYGWEGIVEVIDDKEFIARSIKDKMPYQLDYRHFELLRKRIQRNLPEWW